MPRGKKCPECGKPYIHFDLHWNICPKNTEVADDDVAQDDHANTSPLRKLAPSNSKSEDIQGSNIPKIVEILKAYEPSQDTIQATFYKDELELAPLKDEHVLVDEAQDTSLDDIFMGLRVSVYKVHDTEVIDSLLTDGQDRVEAWHKAEVANLLQVIEDEVIKVPECNCKHARFIVKEQQQVLKKLKDNVINGGSL